MNVQIFGTAKSFDTQKARRYFSERKISVQFINLKEKPMSRGEFNSVAAALGGYENLLDPKAKDQDLLALVRYLTEETRPEKILENQQLLKTPIVRNGRQATIGYAPETWKSWT